MQDLEQIGRYTITRELGRGGMATVYLAHDPRFERDVAIKVLPRQFTHDPRFLTRFEREAKTIAALEHPAIVPVHDFGEYDDAPYLVMRYMSGGSLRQRMQGEPLPLAEIKRILDRLAPALDKAHARGVVHRDLKPDNVLFDEDNRPYLADFGIARLAEATQTMTVVGTPAYMSPEQVQGQGQLDGRSDIYAVGVMLFEMLTGKQPYVADTPTRQMMKHLLEPVPDVVATNPALTPGWQTVIDTVLAKEPAERYATAAALVAAVAALLPRTATSAPPVAEIVVPIAAVQPPSPAQNVPANSGGEESAVQPDISASESPPSVRQARSPLAETMIDTPPEMIAPPTQSRSKLPAWAWWGAAGLILLLLAWGISAMFMSPVPTLGSTRQRSADKMTMVYVPGGTFPMGSENGDFDERPIHEVTLASFWIDQTEVTNAQYAGCVKEGGCEPSSYVDVADFNGENQPVVGVSWFDADVYCKWVGASLPTEAQWEYAARGVEGLIYPWGNEPIDCDLANFGGCVGTTTPVGKYPNGASWVGAMDMSGNVWEWTEDWYDKNYYANAPADDPHGLDNGRTKVVRGGAWNTNPLGGNLRAAARNYNGPTYSYFNIGLRCVQE